MNRNQELYKMLCGTCTNKDSCCNNYGSSPCCYCNRVRKCPDQNPKSDNYMKREDNKNA